MSFQAYLDNIKAKTGKTAEDFMAMAEEKNLTKTADILAWLKTDFGLGHGHAMAIVHLIVHQEHQDATPDDRADKLFSGNKAKWRAPFDDLLAQIKSFGSDADISIGQTYINLLRGGKKFGIVQPSSSERLDIGIKLKGVDTGGRLEPAGSWNSMVTHRVHIGGAEQIDNELTGWLREAYLACR
jgi:hypothetical protein